MKFNCKSFLAYLDMFGQGAVSESETRFFVDHIDYSARTKRPKAEMMREKSYIAARFDPCIWMDKFETGNLEHFPLADRISCILKIFISPTKELPVVIDVVAGGRSFARCADLGIREFVRFA